MREGEKGEGAYTWTSMEPFFLSPPTFLFVETINVQIQCISCFNKVHPWVFGTNCFIVKIVLQLSFFLHSQNMDECLQKVLILS